MVYVIHVEFYSTNKFSEISASNWIYYKDLLNTRVKLCVPHIITGCLQASKNIFGVKDLNHTTIPTLPIYIVWTWVNTDRAAIGRLPHKW